MALENASRSSGFRLVTRLSSSTTSRSTQRAPALMRSVLIDGQDVTVFPSSASASTSIQGPWHTAATVLPAVNMVRTSLTMSRLVRSLSGE